MLEYFVHHQLVDNVNAFDNASHHELKCFR